MLTKIYTDFTYWETATYLSLAKYDSDNSLVYLDDDSAGEALNSDNEESAEEEEQDSAGQNLQETPEKGTSGTQGKDATEDLMSDDSSPPYVVRKQKRKNKAKGRKGFILDEAEDAYDDEECFLPDEPSELADSSMADFIDDRDEEELKAEEGDEKGEECPAADDRQQVNYMESVSDIVGQPNKFKLKFDYDRDINVYSQMPSTQEVAENTYENDSFCNDEIIYSNTQPTANFKTPSPFLRLRSKKMVRKQSTPKEDGDNKTKKRFRRVIIESP